MRRAFAFLPSFTAIAAAAVILAGAVNGAGHTPSRRPKRQVGTAIR